jgi:ABC-2 type transport system permease protein
VVASLVAGRWLLAGYPSLFSGAVLRAGAGSVLYLLLIALLGLGAAAAVRGAAAAAGGVLGLLYLLPIIAQLLPDLEWQRTLYRIAPSTAGMAIQTTVDAAAMPIGPLAGLAVAAAWGFLAYGVGGALLSRRDV